MSLSLEERQQDIIKYSQTYVDKCFELNKNIVAIKKDNPQVPYRIIPKGRSGRNSTFRIMLRQSDVDYILNTWNLRDIDFKIAYDRLQWYRCNGCTMEKYSVEKCYHYVDECFDYNSMLTPNDYILNRTRDHVQRHHIIPKSRGGKGQGVMIDLLTKHHKEIHKRWDISKLDLVAVEDRLQWYLGKSIDIVVEHPQPKRCWVSGRAKRFIKMRINLTKKYDLPFLQQMVLIQRLMQLSYDWLWIGESIFQSRNILVDLRS
jgi:hypothetical protein